MDLVDLRRSRFVKSSVEETPHVGFLFIPYGQTWWLNVAAGEIIFGWDRNFVSFGDLISALGVY